MPAFTNLNINQNISSDEDRQNGGQKSIYNIAVDDEDSYPYTVTVELLSQTPASPILFHVTDNTLYTNGDADFEELNVTVFELTFR